LTCRSSGTDDRLLSSVGMGVRPAKLHEKLPGTDKPDMNFWLTLPEIRCQACLSPSARSGGPMCEVLFRPRHPRASLHPLLKIRRVFLGAHRVEWREAKRERGQFRHPVWRIHGRHHQRPAHQRHRIRVPVVDRLRAVPERQLHCNRVVLPPAPPSSRRC